MIATFFSQPVVYSTSLVEVLTVVGLVSLVAGLYRHVECHQQGCHRFGRFPHGHFHLCAHHHPKVPSDGKIRAEHIKEIK